MKMISCQWSVVRKTFFCFALCALLCALCSHVAAQQSAKIPKIGWLGARSFSDSGAGQSSGAELFRREFRKLGYVETGTEPPHETMIPKLTQPVHLITMSKAL